MQDAHNEYAVGLGKIEDDVTANFESPQAGLDRIAGTADGGVAS